MSWTVVAARKNRRPRRPPPPPPPAPPSDSPSPSGIGAAYASAAAAWAASPSAAALRALRFTAPRVSRAVCLGLGSLDPPDGACDGRRRAFVQLAAFLAMVRALELAHGRAIPCVFQDPVFSAADRAFIASLGHAVVDPPAALGLLAPDAFLFAVHLYRPVYATALRDALPAVFVGTAWDVWHGLSLDGAADLDNLRVMDETYDKAPFPEDPYDTAFSSTSIYWRRPSAEPGSDGVP